MDFEKEQLPDMGHCPVINIDGSIVSGKQFDIEINLPEDNRNVVYGVVKDCYGDPVRNAVVKLIEVDNSHKDKELKPVSHALF